MMTAFRNSITWKDTVHYAVAIYSFLITGKQMSGKEFVDVIKRHYETDTPRDKAIIAALEEHLVSIKVTYRRIEYSVK